MKRTIVIIGGAHGGPTAAAKARQFNEHADIILVEKSPHVSWVQADLRHYLSGDLTRFEKSLKEKEKFFSKQFNIDVRVNTEAVSFDMDSHLVFLKVNDKLSRVKFDAVVFAGGAFSKQLDVPGLDGANVSNFRNLPDIIKLKSAIDSGAKKIVIFGCGFYGIEAAQGLRSIGISVDIVEKEPRILPRFSLPTAQAIVSQLEDKGVAVHLGEQLIAAKRKKNIGFELELSSGKKLSADYVIVTVGSLPRTDLLAAAGAALQTDGTVRVDEHMLTSLPNIYACGSAVSVLQTLTHKRLWIPQPSIVERSAQIAGHNAAVGETAKQEILKPISGTQTLRVNKSWFCRTGLTLAEARNFFGETKVFTSTVHSHVSETWFEGEDIAVSLIVDRNSESIVGGEVFGKRGVSRRIDMLSVAVAEKWSPQKLLDLDMAYTPLLGPAFDPLKEAGTLACMTLSEKSNSLSGENLALWIAQNRPFTLIDVSKRRSTAFKWPSAVKHLPLEELRDRLEEVEIDRPVIVSRRSGRRSFLAHRILMQRGFTDVYHLDGGELTWSLMMG
ncbi:MAG: FAD-dependent oxidoreductase [bacterium]|nr:FAD-dependent oxidoreductase [bacterium]